MGNRQDDTQIGGDLNRFPTTSVSAIFRVRNESLIVRQEALQRIVEGYWKPAYKYVRIKWRKSNEDAKDLIQGFFAQALEKGFFLDFDPSKARFRTFFRVCLDGYLSKVDRAAHALKRGGGAEIVGLPFDEAEVELQRQGIAAADPTEEGFRKEWVRHLLTLAIEDLQKTLTARGRARQFEVFQRHDLCESDHRPPSYAELAAEFAISTTDVTNWLVRARQEFRGIVLGRLRELTGDDDDFQAEARALLGPERG